MVAPGSPVRRPQQAAGRGEGRAKASGAALGGRSAPGPRTGASTPSRNRPGEGADDVTHDEIFQLHQTSQQIAYRASNVLDVDMALRWGWGAPARALAV